MINNLTFFRGYNRNINTFPSTSIGTTYKTITINKTYVPSTLSNHVIKLDASILGTDFFTKLGIGGSARFTASDGVTQLSHEKVYLTTGSSKGYYNVLVPTVNGTAEGSSTAIRCYYENSLSDLAATDTYGRNSVWVNNYKCVQHLQTTPDQPQVNSTGNTSYDMTGYGTLLSTDVITAYYAGGNAHIYDATGQYFNAAYCDITGYPFSMGIAFRTPTLATDNGFICGFSDSTSTNPFSIYKLGLKTARNLYATSPSQGIVYAPIITNMESTTWNFAVATYTSATSRSLYLNAITPASNTTSLAFNSDNNNTSIGYMNLATDQIMSNTGDLAVQDFFLMDSALSANTYTTMYNNYTNASFFTVT